MKRCLGFYRSIDPAHRANAWAAALALLAVVGLRIEFSPNIAGADFRRISIAKVGDVKLDFSGAPAVPGGEGEVVLADASGSGTAPLPAASAATAPLDPHMATLQRKVAMLRKGLEFLDTVPDYTAQFTKQELVNGELTEEQTIFAKIRHEPFSVYLKWLTGDAGREALYVAGENNGKMVVHAGGWKARLPALNIEPDSSIAMSEARYPLTKAGIKELAVMSLAYHEKDLISGNLANCKALEGQTFGDRPCTAFMIEYKSKDLSPDYRKTIAFIDNEWNVPVYMKNYSWPGRNTEAVSGDELDEQTLIEMYSFTDIQMRSSLAAADFEAKNEEYRFR